jgi:tetratricopeptide (TPR) repeat protein
VTVAEEFDVFISYGHADQPWVRVLAENLERAGLHVFYDEWEIGAGDVLIHRLDAGIRGSTAGILVVSQHALSRPWVAREYAAMLTRAIDGRQRLIPVLLADAEMPPLLASIVWVDFRNTHDPASYEARVGELVAELRGRRRSRPAVDGMVRPPPGQLIRAEGPRSATLRISATQVRLTTVDGTIAGWPAGLDWSAGQVLAELDRVRARRSAAGGPPVKAAVADAGVADQVDTALRDVGRMLGERFLSAQVAATLAAELGVAVRAGASLRLGIEIVDEAGAEVRAGEPLAGSTLADLPWETLTLPTDVRPLVLHPRVELHRAVPGLGATPAMGIRGPLRILAVIASPERGGGELLDYEAELARILEAVSAARRNGRAYVRILNWGSRAAIRAVLQAQRFHVLHLSCHAQPGRLVLETAEGGADLVGAETFAAEVLVRDRGVPLVILAGCSTALTAWTTATATTARTADAADGDAEPDSDGERLLPGLARDLLAYGVPAVLAMTAPVTDQYATAMTSRLYGELAGRAVPDPSAALADARRAVETERAALPAADRRAGLVEWATPALFLRGPSLPLFDPAAGFETIAEPAEPVPPGGLVIRRVGEFVGRRAELRHMLATLRGSGAGAVVHGIGGVGKSTLAAQLIAGLGDDTGLVVSLTGQVGVDQILATIASRLASWCFAHNIDVSDVRHRLIDVLRSGDTRWQDRLALLAEHLLPTLPVMLLLDNAEDNLTAEGDGVARGFVDSQLGEFIVEWVTLPQRAKLLVTSRFPIPMDGPAARRLTAHHLGPLSVAEARKLLWRLPALDALTPAEQTRAVADVGGHPRTLEYLDALLRGGEARFPDVAAKLEATLRDRGVADPAAWFRQMQGDLDRAVAETVTLAVDDVLLDDLLSHLDAIPLAHRLLVGASVYRLPVDTTGLAWQVSELAEAEPDPNPALDNILGMISQAQAAGATSLDQVGLTEAQTDLYRDWLDRQRPPDGFDEAVAALLDLGLLAPIDDSGTDSEGGTPAQSAFIVHRWTATAILDRANPNALADSHRHAAAYWQWHVASWPQDPLADVTQQLEAGHHLLAIGDFDGVWETSGSACDALHALGLWDWEEQVCRQTLMKLPPVSPATAAFAHQAGVIARDRGDYDRAERLFRQALGVFEEIGDRQGGAATRGSLGTLVRLRGDFDAAEHLYRQALSVFEETGHNVNVAAMLGSLGHIARHRGDYASAESFQRQALDLYQEIGDRTGVATSLYDLAVIAASQDNYDTAEQLNQEALAIDEELGDRRGSAQSYELFGVIAEARSDYARAEQFHRQALTIAEEIGYRRGVAQGFNKLGLIADRRGEYPTAEERYRKALAIEEEIGDRQGSAHSYHQLGVIAQVQGDNAAAERFYRQALAIFEDIGDRPNAAASCHQLGMLALYQRDYASAEELLKRALATFDEIGNRGRVAAGRQELGKIAQLQGDYDTAERLNGQALAVFEEIGDKERTAQGYGLLGALRTEQGRPADGVLYNLISLSLEIEIDSPNAHASLYWLSRQREMLGEEAFRDALTEHLSPDDVGNVMRLLDSSDSETSAG